MPVGSLRSPAIQLARSPSPSAASASASLAARGQEDVGSFRNQRGSDREAEATAAAADEVAATFKSEIHAYGTTLLLQSSAI